MPADAATRRHREDVVNRLVEAVNAGDAERAADTFEHPRIELIGLNRVYDGRDAVVGYLRERRQRFPDQRNRLIQLYHADDAVVAESWLEGTAAGAIGGIPASGRGFRCRMATFFIFADERLICQRLYFDVGTIARQLA